MIWMNLDKSFTNSGVFFLDYNISSFLEIIWEPTIIITVVVVVCCYSFIIFMSKLLNHNTSLRMDMQDPYDGLTHCKSVT